MIECRMIVYQQSLELRSFLLLFIRSCFAHKTSSLIASIITYKHILAIFDHFLNIRSLHFLLRAQIRTILRVICVEGIEVDLIWEHNRKEILVKRIRILKKKQRHLFLSKPTSHPISPHKTAPSLQGEGRRRLALLHFLPLLLQESRLLLLLQLRWGGILLQNNNVLNLSPQSHNSPQPPLQLSHHLHGSLELLFLQDLRPVPLVYRLHCLLDPLLEEEVECGEGVFYISYLMAPEMYEVAVVGPRQFLAVIFYLVLHEGAKLPPESLDSLRGKEQLDVHQDDEIVSPRVAVLLETLLEDRPLRPPQQFPEQSPGDTDELFM